MNELLVKQLLRKGGPLEETSINEITSLTNGSHAQTWSLVLDDGRKLFAKTGRSNAIERFKFEAQGLAALSKWASNEFIEIPNVIALEEIHDAAVLLLPWLNLEGGNQHNLGKGLALIHQSSANQSSKGFGWEDNGFIGYGPQPKGWYKSWGECFIELRLKPQLTVAKKWGVEKISSELPFENIASLLNSHSPLPSLVHGDLWCGNASVLDDKRGVIIDPAVWWADREVDLAMTKLFGGFSSDFYNAYEEVLAISPSANERIEIYNLYHLLNHANLFGGSYIEESCSCLKKLKKLYG